MSWSLLQSKLGEPSLCWHWVITFYQSHLILQSWSHPCLSVNPFVSNAPFLYPLKTSPLGFLILSRWYRKVAMGNKWVNWFIASGSSWVKICVTTVLFGTDLQYFPKVMWPFDHDIISIVQISLKVIGVWYQTFCQNLINTTLPEKVLYLFLPEPRELNCWLWVFLRLKFGAHNSFWHEVITY